MKNTKDKKETEIRKIELTGHCGKPEFPSYVKVNQLHMMSAADLYFSSEESGQLVHRMCWWLAGYSVRHLERMMEETGLDEIYEIVRKISECPPLMGIGILRGSMMTTYEKDAAEALEVLNLCEQTDDRVYDCFMDALLTQLKNDSCIGQLIEDYCETEGGDPIRWPRS